MRTLLPALLLLASGCASMAEPTPPVPTTSHAVTARDYPDDARVMNEQGAATVRYLVLQNGTVGNAQIEESSGFPRLDQASIQLVKRWQFKPAMQNGKPIAESLTAEVVFRLVGEAPAYLEFAVYSGAGHPEPGITLSSEAQKRIAPIYALYRQIAEDQSHRPSPATDTERLIRLGEIDRLPREWLLLDFNLSGLPSDQQSAAFRAVWNEINRHDLQNQQALKSMLPPPGWFLKSRYGQQAIDAAFAIVYHAVNDPALQRSMLTAIERMVPQGEIRARAYAYLYDRIAVDAGQPQRYGTEFVCRDNEWALAPIEDPVHVDIWRTTVGFESTAQQNAARAADAMPCF